MRRTKENWDKKKKASERMEGRVEMNDERGKSREGKGGGVALCSCPNSVIYLFFFVAQVSPHLPNDSPNFP